jgi:hypothetical protein
MADLVPETRNWNGGNGIGLELRIGCSGNIEHAIAYGELFWPGVYNAIAFNKKRGRITALSLLQWAHPTA